MLKAFVPVVITAACISTMVSMLLIAVAVANNATRWLHPSIVRHLPRLLKKRDMKSFRRLIPSEEILLTMFQFVSAVLSYGVVAPYAAFASCTAAGLYWLKTSVLISSFVMYRRDATGSDMSVIADNLEKSLDQSLVAGLPRIMYTFLISLSGAMVGLYAVDIAADDNDVSWSTALCLLFVVMCMALCLEVFRRRQYSKEHLSIVETVSNNVGSCASPDAVNPILKEMELT